MRLGVYGGTFNPPHLGHLVCAQEALAQLELHRVLFIPASRPPHKPVPEDPGPEHRLALCRAAVAGDERFEVSALEIERQGTSYTVDTLEELTTNAPDSELFLILGGDMAAGLPSWHQAERILALATPVLASRKGTSRRAMTEALGRLCGGERAEFVNMPTVEISSTMIRERTAVGQPIRYLVPEGVAAYIDRHGLYRGEEAA